MDFSLLEGLRFALELALFILIRERLAPNGGVTGFLPKGISPFVRANYVKLWLAVLAIVEKLLSLAILVSF